jgi:hypothetical protein
MAKTLHQQYPAVVRTAFFNLDNGAGTTIDEPVFNSGPNGAQIVRVYCIYGETAQTVAAGNFRVGSTVGGADIVAPTAYTNAATVGSITNATLLYDTIPANTLVSVRHTGVAATQTGTASVVIEYVVL